MGYTLVLVKRFCHKGSVQDNEAPGTDDVCGERNAIPDGCIAQGPGFRVCHKA